MCRPDFYIINAFHIKANPFLSEISEFVSDYQTNIITLLIFSVIFVVFLTLSYKIERKKKLYRRLSYLTIGLFLLVFLFQFAGWRCGPYDYDYYSSNEFKEHLKYPGELFHQARFYNGGTLDLSDTEYFFQCNNDLCYDSIQISDNAKSFTVNKDSFGIFFTCGGSEYVKIHIFYLIDDQPVYMYRPEGRAENITGSDCINSEVDIIDFLRYINDNFDGRFSYSSGKVKQYG